MTARLLDHAFLDRFLASPLDADVRGWALAIIVGSLSRRERRLERDRWIRAAAALTPGARWTRARELHAIAVELAAALPTSPDTSSARGCMATAMLVRPGVPSAKQISRVIGRIAVDVSTTP